LRKRPPKVFRALLFGFWLGESGALLGGAVASEADGMRWISCRVELC
jgi:hypothetical protein